jgi:hypothetical protein
VTALRRAEPAARVVWPPFALCAFLVVTWALVDGFGNVVYKDTAVRLFLTLMIVLGLQIFSGNSGVLSFGHRVHGDRRLHVGAADHSARHQKFTYRPCRAAGLLDPAGEAQPARGDPRRCGSRRSSP